MNTLGTIAMILFSPIIMPLFVYTFRKDGSIWFLVKEYYWHVFGKELEDNIYDEEDNKKTKDTR